MPISSFPQLIFICIFHRFYFWNVGRNVKQLIICSFQPGLACCRDWRLLFCNVKIFQVCYFVPKCWPLLLNEIYLFIFSAQANVLKYVSLFLLCSQNAILILVMRYVRTRAGDMFMSTTAVICSEFFKFTACLVVIFIQVSWVE